MMRSRRRPGQGFTLIEMMVSIAVLALLVAMSVGPYNDFRARQEANQCAQGLAAMLRQTATYALRNERYAYLYISSATTYDIRVMIPTPGQDNVIGTSDDKYAYELMKSINVSGETPRARLSPVGAYIAFGPKGWLQETPVTWPDGADTYGYTHPITVQTETSGSVSYTYYPITVTSGPNVGQTYTIRVYKNGRVKVI